MRDGETRGERVYNEGATQHGLTTGGIRPCTLEGCRGDRIAVRWPNGERSHYTGLAADRAYRIRQTDGSPAATIPPRG